MAELVIVSTASMLSALEGFAAPERRHRYGGGFTEADIDLIRSYYERYSRPDGCLQYGKAKEIALALGRDPRRIGHALNRLRHRGVLAALPIVERKLAAAKPKRRPYARRPPGNPRSLISQEVYLREWLSERAKVRQPVAPRLARPAWFEERVDKARLMAGR